MWAVRYSVTNKPNLFRDVRIHLVVRLPFLLGSIDVEPSTSAEVPAVILPINVTPTCTTHASCTRYSTMFHLHSPSRQPATPVRAH